ncbi:9011_t:CDS:1, partial [Scutellospora calospora]
FWILVICFHINSLTTSYEFPRLVVSSMFTIWPLNLLISLLGLAFQAPNSPFYASINGSWCWISPNYKFFRMIFNYSFTLTINIAEKLVLVGEGELSSILREYA